MAKFFLQKFVISNMITDSFLAEKWGTLYRARRYVCKNLLNLDCQDIRRAPVEYSNENIQNIRNIQKLALKTIF